jgi:hypothetical protein
VRPPPSAPLARHSLDHSTEPAGCAGYVCTRPAAVCITGPTRVNATHCQPVNMQRCCCIRRRRHAAGSPSLRRRVSSHTAFDFFRHEMGANPPRLLREFVKMQSLRGYELLEPDAEPALHPLMVPLARAPQRLGGAVQGILRMPPSIALGGDMQWPLVEAGGSSDTGDAGTAFHYKLRAKSVCMHANRLAAQADFSQPDHSLCATSVPRPRRRRLLYASRPHNIPYRCLHHELLGDIIWPLDRCARGRTVEMLAVLASAAATDGSRGGYVYEAGQAPTSKSEQRTFLLLKVGLFADLLHELSAEHLMCALRCITHAVVPRL